MSRPPLGDTLNLFGLQIQWYSLLIMIAVAVGIWLATREETRLRLPRDTILNFALLAIPLGIIGARLYYVLFSWSHFSGDLLSIFRVWEGGLAIYGGFLGGILAGWIISRTSKGKVPLMTLLDACMPSLALGQAIARWGNYANMEAYGARVYEEALQFFPFAVEIQLIGANGAEFWYWHMATFFYESAYCLIVFLLLMKFRRSMQRRGDVTLWYFLLYCAGRTVIEGLRDDSLLLNVAAAQVRVSQILSAIACIAVVVVFFLRLRRMRKLHLADYLCWAVAALGIVCTFLGEFERNAYQMLFIPAQVVLGLLLALDVFFFFHYFTRARIFNSTSIAMLVAAGLCGVTLLLGIGRVGGGNLVYITLRQLVAMAHVVLGGAWFYLRLGAPAQNEAVLPPSEGYQPWNNEI